MKKVFMFLVMVGLGYLFTKDPHFLTISAGVAIFLYGMLSLENGFQAFAGGMLEKFLKKTTDKIYKSLGFGVVTTTLMQSSSLVSILAISFLSAGLIGLEAGMGIIFGANIGTTTGAWLVAGLGLKVKISTYAMPMLVFGMMLIFRKGSRTLQGLGYVLAGLGFLFLGIHYMKEGFEAFKDTFDLSQYAIGGLKGILIYVGIGIAATVVMQSSHATLVLIITALAASQITYDNALALAIGSNVGTTITAIIGSLSTNIEGKKLAAAHLVFNLITGLVAIIFLHQFIYIVDHTAEFFGIAHDDYTLKLALFHTFFNVLGVCLMVPFIHKLAVALDKYIKPPKQAVKAYDDAIYLNESAVAFPDTAKEALYKETKHLYANAQNFISYSLSINPVDIGSGATTVDIVKMRNRPIKKDLDDLYNRKIKPIYNKIINFAVKAQINADEESMLELMNIRKANLFMADAIKDAQSLQTNILKYIDYDNEHISKEYNNIRKKLIKELRYMQMFLNTEEEDLLIVLINKLMVASKKFDAILGKNLEEHIRENRISSNMATSLMNDTSFASSIATNLTKMAKMLYENKKSKFPDIAKEILLEDEDIDDIIKQTPTQRQNSEQE